MDGSANLGGVESAVSAVSSPAQHKIKRFRAYHRAFQTAYGEQPWWCLRCGEEAEVIHHVDHDRTNNEIENLQSLCSNCHRFVHRGQVRPPATGQNIAASKRGKPRSEDTKRKLSEALKGKPATKSAESRRGRRLSKTHRENLSKATKRWWDERRRSDSQS